MGDILIWVTYKGEPTNFSLNKGTAVHVSDLEDYNHIMLKKMKKNLSIKECPKHTYLKQKFFKHLSHTTGISSRALHSVKLQEYPLVPVYST